MTAIGPYAGDLEAAALVLAALDKAREHGDAYIISGTVTIGCGGGYLIGQATYDPEGDCFRLHLDRFGEEIK